MVPLFKSVGYQLINHTFTEKCEYIKFEFRTPPINGFFNASWNRKNNPHPPQDVQISRLQTCFAP